MRIYAIGYFEEDTYKVKRVKAKTVAEAHEKANLDTPIVRIRREEWNIGEILADMRGEDDYERAIEQIEHDILYESAYNPEDGSM